MQKYFAVCLTLAFCSIAIAQETREEKLSKDRDRFEHSKHWIYNDIDKGFATAKRTGKPLLVVLRCIPCEECVKLDDELMDRDPTIRPLLDKFVCVRQVSTNGLDLTLFQYDTDQSFAVFMLNSDKTIYGRFGTRSHRTEWLGDVSLPGMAKALRGALDLHEQFPANKKALSGKRGAPWETSTPAELPSLKEHYSDQWNKDVRSCIHCHQIGEARRNFYRQASKPIPERLLFPTPHPKVIGLTLDPKEMATVIAVAPKSPAAAGGMQAGDKISRLNGQPILSIADVQWVLDGAKAAGDNIAVEVNRDNRVVQLKLELEQGWRRKDDLSWRASSWALRRMTAGGLVLESLSGQGRGDPAEAKDQPTDESMRLRVKYVGQYGPHSAAKRAGFKKDDIIVEFDGRRDLLRETDLLVHGTTQRKVGDKVPVTVLRNGKEIRLTMPMQP